MNKRNKRTFFFFWIFLFLWHITFASDMISVQYDKSDVRTRYIPEEKIQELKRDSRLSYEDPERAPVSFWKRILNGIFRLLELLFSNQGTAKIIRYILFAVIVLFILSNVFKIGFYNIFTPGVKTVRVHIDGMEEDIHEMDFTQLIEGALKEQNYPLAIRLHYLHTLKLLTNKRLIKWRQDKTNREYIFELRNSKYMNPFQHVTRWYEYAWYGQFYVEKPLYVNIAEDFHTFNRLLAADEKK